jgi:hypothetical protein
MGSGYRSGSKRNLYGQIFRVLGTDNKKRGEKRKKERGKRKGKKEK